MQRIYNFGARKFALVGTGPIGCCPQQRKGSSSADCNATTNSICVQYVNGVASLLEEMKSELRDMNYSLFNSSRALMEYIENPENYGMKTCYTILDFSLISYQKANDVCTVIGFTEVKAACCGLGDLHAKVACFPVSSLCYNRSNHIFWDLFHPTETTAKFLAATFFKGSSPYVHPINVKQLSDLWNKDVFLSYMVTRNSDNIEMANKCKKQKYAHQKDSEQSNIRKYQENFQN